MTISATRIRVCGLALAALLPLGSAHAAETVLYSFQGGSDGTGPLAGLIMDGAGNLYGTTVYGGPNCDCGTVYKVSPDGTETVLHAFAGGDDGYHPYGALVADQNGDLYGTTIYGGGSGCKGLGCGTVFEVTPDGTETVLYSFQRSRKHGSGPVAGLIMDSSGKFFGTTGGGGASGAGTVFRLAPDGRETVLYSFHGTDGFAPEAGLIMDKSGNLYGTTAAGGADNQGVVFELAPDGTETTLHSFQGGSDGGDPQASLIMDRAGNLYGTTEQGGGGGCNGDGCGTVFELAPDGTESVLYAFRGTHGTGPAYAGVIMDKAGILYGTTTGGGAEGDGTVFKLAPKGTETVLYSFQAGSDGRVPYGGVIMDSSGNLYGTTYDGGATNNGTVFELTTK